MLQKMDKMSKSKDRVAFLVVSCDNYSDVWDIFFNNLSKYWPNCPYNVYLQSNFKDFFFDGEVQTLKVGKDKSWSDGLMNALNQLRDYDFVLLTLEDLVIKDFVNNDLINTTIESFIDNGSNYLSLINEPKPDKRFNSIYGEISSGAMYRSTSTFAIWNRKTLLSLLDTKENAWEFEKIGSQRSNIFGGFYSVYSDLFPYINTIIKGKWTYEALQYFKKNNISFNESRGKMTLVDWNKHKFYRFIRGFILMITPFKLRKLLLRIN